MKDFNNQLGKYTERIIGIANELHNAIGPGFVENIYHNGMKKLLDRYQIPYKSEMEIKIMLDDDIIGIHRLDLVVYNKVIIELKAVED